MLRWVLICDKLSSLCNDLSEFQEGLKKSFIMMCVIILILRIRLMH